MNERVAVLDVACGRDEKVKMSLRDFALRKKREEEMMKNV
jgi:hypothetical protein